MDYLRLKATCQNIDEATTWTAIGFTKRELARRLGSKSKTPALQLNTRKITAANTLKVERFYRQIMAH